MNDGMPNGRPVFLPPEEHATCDRASDRIGNDADATWFQYLLDAGEATDRIREMHKQGADKDDVVSGTDTCLGNLRRVRPDGLHLRSQ